MCSVCNVPAVAEIVQKLNYEISTEHEHLQNQFGVLPSEKHATYKSPTVNVLLLSMNKDIINLLTATWRFAIITHTAVCLMLRGVQSMCVYAHA